MSNPEVNMSDYTPLPKGERPPFMSELEQEIPDQSAGKTPLDDLIADDRIVVEGWSAYSESGRGNTRLWVIQEHTEEETE